MGAVDVERPVAAVCRSADQLISRSVGRAAGQPVAVWRRVKTLRTLASLNRTVVEPTANGAVLPADGVTAIDVDSGAVCTGIGPVTGGTTVGPASPKNAFAIRIVPPREMVERECRSTSE